MKTLSALACVVACGLALPAHADTPSPATIELARQVLRYDGSFDAISAAIAAKRSADIKMVARLFNIGDARATLFVDKYWIPEMKARLQDFVDVGAEIYASKMSAADLQAVAAFFQTPAGQKLVTTRAEVGKELTTGARAWQHGVMVDALRRFNGDAATHDAR